METEITAETHVERPESKATVLINNFVYRIKYMTSIEPIIGNLIAIGLYPSHLKVRTKVFIIALAMATLPR